ncbi:hypothetical protein VTN77DRAFT_3165 [Rasamsonia byssochlamydoides]|uniref:uncharacterized protein n=1 Tax=Rasamsonia byssochlamydoides TaxID=89139 RepID=UPI00374461A7
MAGTKYSRLEEDLEKLRRDSVSEDDGSHHSLIQKDPSSEPGSFFQNHWLLLCHICLLLLNVVVFSLMFLPGKSLQERQKACGRLLGKWLPDWEDGVEYETQQFVGTFNHQTAFTGVGPEVDRAWDNITNGPTGGAIGITKEQWEAVNPYHEWPVMLEEPVETGQYLASLDVFHQLHCVDLLRKSLHREYYDKHEGSFAGAPEAVVQGHLEHCIETLRQTLMCHGDISLLTYNWVKGREMPYPNFNTIHTCKKWDTLVAWNQQRDISSLWKGGTKVKEYVPPTKPADIEGMWPPP